MEEKKIRSRGWTFTINNYTEAHPDTIHTNPDTIHGDIDTLHNIDCTYMIYGLEEAPSTGTKHIQGYIYFENAKSFKTIKRLLGEKTHIEKAKGTAEQNKIYCSKEGKFFERGVMPKQGKRTDLDELKKRIIDGESINNITLENPTAYHQYGRTMIKIEQIKNESKFRTWKTEGLWLWGPTGTGKSFEAYKNFKTETHYVWKFNDNGWQDGYNGQEIVIMDDFRGQIKYSELLNILDQYPYTLSRRYLGPIPFLAKKVIITSPSPPEKIYFNIAGGEDSIDQLLRRITVKEHTQKWSG